MSPRRFNVETRLIIYQFLVQRDGEVCARCCEKPTVTYSLDIHHIDGDHFNHHPSNLVLLCRRCNNSVRLHEWHPLSASERERKEGHASTRIVRQAVGYSHPDSPVTMQANFLFEVDARAWVLSQLAEKGFYPKLDAIAGMAELVGCSTLTSTRYLAKLTGPLGPLQEVKDMLGCIMLTWKEGHKPEPIIKLNLDSGEKVAGHEL